MTDEIRNKILSQVQHRTITLDRAAIDVGSRTVTLAFSSETPVERWYGYEILDHKPDCVRMGRLMDGAPCLLQHDPDEQIGVVESPVIGPDAIGRCKVRFSKSEDAEEVFQDVIDGIRSKISVGYMVHAMVLEKKEGDTEYYRITDWEPYEVSFVSIPADNSVGVGRAAETDNATMNLIVKEVEKQLSTITTSRGGIHIMPEDNKPTLTPEQILGAERERMAAIDSWGKRFVGRVDKIDELITSAIRDGITVDAFKGMVAERIPTGQPVTTDDELGLSDKEVRQFSLARAIQYQVMRADGEKRLLNGDMLDASFELEVSNAYAKKIGGSARGIFMPPDVMRRKDQRGVLTVGAGTGGQLVATNLLGSSFIDLLRNKMLASQLGVQMLDGLVGSIAFPRQTTAGTAYYAGENTNITTQSAQAFDQVTASPKDVGAYQDYGRRLLLQSTPSVDDITTNDLITVIALAKDKAVFHGSGGNQPTGIAGTSGIGAPSAANLDWPGTVLFETDVAASNADVNTMAYVTDATGYGLLKGRAKEAGYPVYLLGDDGKMNGYNTFRTNQITAGYLFFGNFAQAIMCNWGGIDVFVDLSTGSIAGTVRVVVFSAYDIAVRHAGAFAVASDLS